MIYRLSAACPPFHAPSCILRLSRHILVGSCISSILRHLELLPTLAFITPYL